MDALISTAVSKDDTNFQGDLKKIVYNCKKSFEHYKGAVASTKALFKSKHFDSKQKFYALVILKEVSKVATEVNVNYFADKMSKRMKDFAIFGKHLPAETRGQTCMDQFRKGSNREWAQKFYRLNLECWNHWIVMAHALPDTKGNKKLLSYADIITKKNQIVLPQFEELYQYFTIDEEGTLRDSRLPPAGFQGETPTPNPPVLARDSGSKKVATVDEARILKGSVELKNKIIEVGSILGGADSYQDYLQDIVNDFDQTNKTNSKLFKPLLDNPKAYSEQLVKHVSEVVKSVGMINKTFEKFARGDTQFADFKNAYLEAAMAMASLADPSDTTGHKIRAEQAEIPKRDDRAVSNFELNSYMSYNINKRANEEEAEDDNIQLPDDMAPSPQDNLEGQKPIKQADDDFGEAEAEYKEAPEGENGGEFAGFMHTNFDEEAMVDDRAAALMPNMNPSQVAKSVDTQGDNDWGRIPAPFSAPEASNQNKFTIDNTNIKPTLAINTESQAESQNKEDKPIDVIPIPLIKVIPNRGSRHSSLKPINPQDTEFTLPDPLKPITEEEKVKLAIKNQSVLGNQSTQIALNDFFSTNEPVIQPKDVFARVRLLNQYKKPESFKQPKQEQVPEPNQEEAFETKEPQRESLNSNGAFTSRSDIGRDPFAPIPNAAPLFQDDAPQLVAQGRMKIVDFFAQPEVIKVKTGEGLSESAELQNKEEIANAENDQEVSNHPPNDEEKEGGERRDWNTVGGLLEDENNDYFPAPDLEKMRKEIERHEKERQARQVTTQAKKPVAVQKDQVPIPVQDDFF